MDKQKQMIEEMDNDIKKIAADWTASCEYSCDSCPYGSCRGKIATFLVNAGYRKIPENAVVLTREENAKALEWLDFNRKKERKETAEKFAERLKAQYPPRTDERCTLDDCYMIDKIDEICKEITEGKV